VRSANWTLPEDRSVGVKRRPPIVWVPMNLESHWDTAAVCPEIWFLVGSYSRANFLRTKQTPVIDCYRAASFAPRG
jgi:hypothetical protein